MGLSSVPVKNEGYVMENNSELVRLEQFVDTVLNKYNDLKDRFHALEATLRERDEECAALKDDVAELRDERSEVGSRVSGLLGRIEQWEAGQDEFGGEEGEQQGSLFEAENQDNG
jgi:chromosome segregation ATPase